jgi:hypothetical protein
LSLSNILRLKFSGIRIAQYLIDINNSKEVYDYRSREILQILKPTDTVNFMHINDVKYSVSTANNKSNAIFFEAIYYTLRPFMSKKKCTHRSTHNYFADIVLKENQSYYSDSYHLYTIVKWILNFLNIEKLIMLDDSRYTNELNLASKTLNISTVGYMHGRFNEYHLGLFEFPFDKYLVWSSYFKNKILSLSDMYREDNIEVVGHFRLKEKQHSGTRGRNILWIGESNINYEEVMPYINMLTDSKYNIFFRGKPGSNNTIYSFLTKHSIRIDGSNSYFESLIENNIGLVIGTHSTALLESWILEVPSLVLKCSYDYGSHLWEDGLIELCTDKEYLSDLVEKYFNISNEEINIVKEKIWGAEYCFNQKKVEDIIVKG